MEQNVSFAPMDVLTNPKTNSDWQNAGIAPKIYGPIGLDSKEIFQGFLRATHFPTIHPDVISAILDGVPGFNVDIDEYNNFPEHPTADDIYSYIGATTKNTSKIVNEILDKSPQIREETGQLTQSDIVNKANINIEQSIVCDAKNNRLILYNMLPENAIILRTFNGICKKSSAIFQFRDNFYNEIEDFYNASDDYNNKYTLKSLLSNFGIYRLILDLDVVEDSDILNKNSQYLVSILMVVDGKVEGLFQRRILNNEIKNKMINVGYINTTANDIKFYWSISSFSGINNFIYSSICGDNIVSIGSHRYLETIVPNNFTGTTIRLHKETTQYLKDYKIINSGDSIIILTEPGELQSPKTLIFYTLSSDAKLSLRVQMFPLNKIHGSSIASCVYDTASAPGDFLSSVEINASTGEH